MSDKLKDKMLEAIEGNLITDDDELSVTKDGAESCAAIADEQAIEFAEWLSYDYEYIYKVWHSADRKEEYTTTELLTKFKNR